MAEIVRKVYTPEEIRQVDGDYTFEAVISTETIDRHGDIVKASGINIDRYMKHPVLLSSHRYDDLRKQIGIVKELRREGKKWVAKYQYFAGEGNEEADWGYKLSQKGIAAFSIGFIPKNWDMEENEDGEVKRVFKEVELIEISQVLIPANPDAIQKSLESDDEIERKIAEVMSEELEEKQEGWSIVGARDLPIDEERSWDGARARDEIRRWASSDGSGDKDKINWSKYRRGFVVGKRGSTNFGDYKLPFARVKNGRLVATLGGVIFAMAAVLGARGGIDIPEDVRRRAYNFLASYYRRFDREPPEYRDISDVLSFAKLELTEKEIEDIKGLLLHIEARLEDLSLKIEELAEAYGSFTSPSGGEPGDGDDNREEVLQAKIEQLLTEVAQLKQTVGGKNDGN